MKPIRIKPSLYAWYFLIIKEVAETYGYNLVLHGSLARDCDVIAIPWTKQLGQINDMIDDMAKQLGGTVMDQTEEEINCFPHGRQSHVINIRRGDKGNNYEDPQYYIDISVIPTI